MIDLLIVCSYFIIIFLTAISGRSGKEVSVEEYFLSSRNLRWPSIALSTIATNINGYQFLGMMGSAYLYGLAQASLEINAIQGILMAAFIFVPLYLREGVVTITQFIKKKLGSKVGLAYSIANIIYSQRLPWEPLYSGGLTPQIWFSKTTLVLSMKTVLSELPYSLLAWVFFLQLIPIWED